MDSGNLAAGLIVIKEAIREAVRAPGINRYCWNGLQDTARTVETIFRDYRDRQTVSDELFQRIHRFTGSMLHKLETDSPQTIPENLKKLRLLKEDALELCTTDLLPVRNVTGDEEMKNILYWIEAPLIQIEALISEWKGLSGAGHIQTGLHTLDEIQRHAAESGAGEESSAVIRRWKNQADNIIEISEKLVREMDFSFLYNKRRGLFHIGYNTEKAQSDVSTYDLLASEARIASYIAIAKGDVHSEHWFRLSRRLTRLGNNELLLSWGGTMFEYLMPMLFMRSFPDTLLSHTYDSIIQWQKEYGAKRGYPWGSSESAYNFLNLEMQYQYRAFGVPGLGLKRGLAEEYVIAPYASLLALMIDQPSSVENLEKIEDLGGLGLFGFYDALDYTSARLKKSDPYKVVKTYMAHHQGMCLAALDNVLNGWPVHRYFHADPQIKACDLLLQERIPRGMPIKEPHPIDVELEPGEQKKIEYIVEHSGIGHLDQSPPRLHLLSNGQYSLFVTHAGTGCSRFEETALNAWEPDATMDPSGVFFYIKDKESGKFWSAGHQPVKRMPDRYDTWFHNGKVITSRVDEWIETTTEICVSSEHPMELRRLTLTNYADRPRKLEVTSYAEIVLNRLADHNSHPAFSKLFVQTDYVAEHHAVLAKRRPRSSSDREQWLIHTVTGHDLENITEPLQFETERAKFIGRGRSLSQPLAMDTDQALSGSLGNVSDPVVSLRRTITLNPGEKVKLVFGMGRADNREEAVRLADISDNPHAADREFDLASVYSMVEQEHIGVTAKEGHFFQKLASYLIYPHEKFRAAGKKLMQNRRNQSGLWAFGISGDLPLMIYRIRDANQLKDVRTLLKAHSFWKLKGLNTDLLILNDHPPSYADELQESIQKAIESSMKGRAAGAGGGVFTLKSEKITDEDLTLLLTVAAAVFEDKLPVVEIRPDTEETSSFYLKTAPAPYRRKRLSSGSSSESLGKAGEKLMFFNGNGGFSADGKEYHVLVGQNSRTGYHEFPPAPWSNIIANPGMGFITTERGGGYTWSRNSRENKLTKWSNDPVRDPCSEAFFIRDEHSREFWSPLPAPCPGDGNYLTAHGFGYSRFEHTSNDISQKLTQFMAGEDPVKISILQLRNLSSRTRRLSLFAFTDLVMGVEKQPASRFIIPEVSGKRHVLYARNYYNNEFAGRVAFNRMAVPGGDSDIFFTTDRSSFIGRNRSLSMPQALLFREQLENRVTFGADVCSAFQTVVEMKPEESLKVIILLGETGSRDEAENLANTYSDPVRAEQELNAVIKSWKEKLTVIQVETPSEALDVMVNGWLMYQNLVSRLMARTAFYQAGGAYGFRDQLQDVMAARYVDPGITRKQILLHASRQFREGDVQHWWHPPTGRGIRSKISDDRLWLPYVTEFYVRSTGDESILEEAVPYVETRRLREDEHEVYLEPEVLDEKGSLYEHCCRAIDISLKMGDHGLPLIGAGDWNDGMNRVGEGGKGESVWLGFFLYDILERFKTICKKTGDDSRAENYGKIAEDLKKNLNKHGWDGQWYLRAFYDDGSPLGSAGNEECRIDVISQAWSVISKAAPKERGLEALQSVEEHLISAEDGIIRLLTPPFDQTEKDPGYIRGYIPGVRENGGQYTHGALWSVKAFADAGMGDKAVRYLEMINPVNHGRTPGEISVYKVEPYVVAADVYGEVPMIGQGGWTWYTGSGGWMYRVALESVLGIGFKNGDLVIDPVISRSWKRYSVSLRTGNETTYKITVENPSELEKGALSGTVDRERVEYASGCAAIPLQEDGQTHLVRLIIRPPGH
ncbi:MAG: glucoamylase family protein [Balneolaceae bacterium]